MKNSRDLKRKTVIDINTAESMGMVCDIDVDLGTGRINSIILPSRETVLGIFGKNKEIAVPWECVKAIGKEYILIDYRVITELLP